MTSKQINEAQIELLTNSGYKVDEDGGYFDLQNRDVRLEEFGGEKFTVQTVGTHLASHADAQNMLKEMEQAVNLLYMLQVLDRTVCVETGIPSARADARLAWKPVNSRSAFGGR